MYDLPLLLFVVQLDGSILVEDLFLVSFSLMDSA